MAIDGALICAIVWESQLTVALPSSHHQICPEFTTLVSEGVPAGVLWAGPEGGMNYLLPQSIVSNSGTWPNQTAKPLRNVIWLCAQEEGKKAYSDYLAVSVPEWHGPLGVLGSSFWKQWGWGIWPVERLLQWSRWGMRLRTRLLRMMKGS